MLDVSKMRENNPLLDPETTYQSIREESDALKIRLNGISSSLGYRMAFIPEATVSDLIALAQSLLFLVEKSRVIMSFLMENKEE